MGRKTYWWSNCQSCLLGSERGKKQNGRETSRFHRTVSRWGSVGWYRLSSLTGNEAIRCSCQAVDLCRWIKDGSWRAKVGFFTRSAFLASRTYPAGDTLVAEFSPLFTWSESLCWEHCHQYSYFECLLWTYHLSVSLNKPDVASYYLTLIL